MEIITDWRDAFECFQQDFDLPEDIIKAIEREINDCENYHKDNENRRP